MNYSKYRIPFPLIDIYFLVWKPNAISKIHNHSRNGCYMFILKGDIKEEIYSKKLSLIDHNLYSTFDLSYINDDKGYHRIINTNKYTYTLHFYHPKNHLTKYFN